MKKMMKRLCLGLLVPLVALAQDYRPQPTDAEKARMASAVPSSAQVKVSRPRQVLVYCDHKGFYHSSIPFANEALKVLGKATEDELSGLIPIIGISPGTLLIGEPLQTDNGDTAVVDFIADVLYQLEQRGLYTQVGRVDFSDQQRVSFTYGDKYTVILGDSTGIEHKFGMVVSVMSQLLDGDIGIIDVSDGTTAHFSPN